MPGSHATHANLPPSGPAKPGPHAHVAVAYADLFSGSGHRKLPASVKFTLVPSVASALASTVAGSAGNVPSNALSLRNRCVSTACVETLEGIAPASKFPERSSLCSAGAVSNMSPGRVPVRPAFGA